jgi:hypothetical protein
MKLNISLTIVFLCVFLVSCKLKINSVSSQEKSSKIKKVELIDGFAFSNKKTNYNIINAEVSENTLSIIVSYGGGCKIHEWALKGPSDFLKSLPPKKVLFLEHNSNGDICREVITDTLQFDVSQIKYPGKEKDYTVIIKLNGFLNKNIIYSY